MIKRRFYKQEHNDDGDDVSDSSSSSSSSSSDSESDSEAPEPKVVEEEEEGQEGETDVVAEEEQPSSTSLGSGYRSEDSSGAEEVDVVESPGLLLDANEDESENGRAEPSTKAKMAPFDTSKEKDPVLAKSAYFILKSGTVFKCRLCPRIVCLSELSLKAHLVSKRHARSEKLLKDGRLKLMLNSDGEVEEDVETHAERHARTLALAQASNQQEAGKPLKKNRGRQRQKLRLKRKKMGDGSVEEKESKKGNGSSMGKEKRSKKGDGSTKGKERRSKKGDGSNEGKVKISKKGEGFHKEEVKRSKAVDGSSDKGKEKESAKHQAKKRRRT